MTARLFMLVGVVVTIGSAHAQMIDIPRTPQGRPDFHGVWESRWLTPFERPDGVETPTVSGVAAAAFYRAQRADLFADEGALHPEGDYDFSGLLPAEDGAYRTSLIVEPDDGKRPQSPLGKEIGETAGERRKIAANPEELSSDARCLGPAGRAPLGVTPGNMYRQIVQTPDHVVVYTEEMMSARMIGIGATPRPEALVSHAGDSLAQWDGDTLVVVTTGIALPPAPPDAPPYDQQRRVTERFALTTPDTISYDYILEDTAMLSEPMRVQYTLIRSDHDLYEAACHEGNYSLRNILLGARVIETRSASPKR